MFGHVDFVVNAAPGVGIVSSTVLQSDCLDEIDWEWLGGDDTQVQSNYFGKGQTASYNRGAFHSAPGNHDGFHTYSIDWTADRIVWSIDGQTVRVQSAADAPAGQYPQTPMMIKVGAWSGGDPSNSAGTIQWAGGYTDYSAGPYTMYLKSVSATDYSTGTSYTYSGSSGTWQSIQSSGGKINSSGSGKSNPTTENAPAITSSVSNSAPLAFGNRGGASSSSAATGSGGQASSKSGNLWYGTATASAVTAITTTYPGLPSGWSVSDSGKVIPPNSGITSSSTFSLTVSTHAKRDPFSRTTLYCFKTCENDLLTNPSLQTQSQQLSSSSQASSQASSSACQTSSSAPETTAQGSNVISTITTTGWVDRGLQQPGLSSKPSLLLQLLLRKHKILRRYSP